MKFLQRSFAKWHDIPKNKVPKGIRAKLYSQKYAVNEKGTREYRKHEYKGVRTVTNGQPEGSQHLDVWEEKYRKQFFSYRNLGRKK